MHLRLYGKQDCPLCDKAAALVRDVLARAPGARLDYHDIENDEELFGRYGLRIPVLQDVATGAELNWPFDAGDVERLVRR